MLGVAMQKWPITTTFADFCTFSEAEVSIQTGGLDPSARRDQEIVRRTAEF
jgi:hypothetical protein